MLIINSNGKWHFEMLQRSPWEPGLPAMQAPRCFSYTVAMLSQASQLPHRRALANDYSALHSARQLSSIRLEKPHSLSYHASTFSNLPLTLV